MILCPANNSLCECVCVCVCVCVCACVCVCVCVCVCFAFVFCLVSVLVSCSFTCYTMLVILIVLRLATYIYILNSHCRAYTCVYYIIYIYLAIVTCMLNGTEIKYLTNKQKTKKSKNVYKYVQKN